LIERLNSVILESIGSLYESVLAELAVSTTLKIATLSLKVRLSRRVEILPVSLVGREW
jgi:hypothetical protein